TRWPRDWSSDVCSSDLVFQAWRRDVETFISTIANQASDLADAKDRITKAIESDLLRFHDTWERITVTADSLISTPRKLLDGGMRSEERRVGKERRGRWR